MRDGQRRSIERHLPVGVRVDAAVVLWRREGAARAVAALVGLAVVTAGVVDAWPSWFVVPVAAVVALVAGVAVADRYVLVQAGGHLVLFRAGRFSRHVGVQLRLVSPLTVERSGHHVWTPRWHVGGQRYRVWPGTHTTIEPMVDAVLSRQPARSGSDPERASGV